MTAYWSLDDIAEQARCGKTKAKKIVAQPGFPAPRYAYSGAHPIWPADEVIEWINAREAA